MLQLIPLQECREVTITNEDKLGIMRIDQFDGRISNQWFPTEKFQILCEENKISIPLLKLRSLPSSYYFKFSQLLLIGQLLEGFHVAEHRKKKTQTPCLHVVWVSITIQILKYQDCFKTKKKTAVYKECASDITYDWNNQHHPVIRSILSLL